MAKWFPGKVPSAPSLLGSLLSKVERQAARAARWSIDPAIWRAAVGARVAERARPWGMSQGVLTVEVASAVWAQELSLLSREIIPRLVERGVPIKALRFRVNESLGKKARTQQRVREQADRVRPLPLPADLQRQVDAIEDDDLRRSVQKAASYSLGLREQRLDREKKNQRVKGRR